MIISDHQAGNNFKLLPRGHRCPVVWRLLLLALKAADLPSWRRTFGGGGFRRVRVRGV
jgi:hypothetical protein